MKKKSIALLMSVVMLAMSGCGDAQQIASTADEKQYKYGEVVVDDDGQVESYISPSLGYRFDSPKGCKILPIESVMVAEGYSVDEVIDNYEQVVAEYTQRDYFADLTVTSEEQDVTLAVMVMKYENKGYTLEDIAVMILNDKMSEEKIRLESKFIAGREFIGMSGMDEGYQTEKGNFLKDEYYWCDESKIILLKVMYAEGCEKKRDSFLDAIKPYGDAYVQAEATYERQNEKEQVVYSNIEQPMCEETQDTMEGSANEKIVTAKEAPAEYRYGELIQSETSNEYKSESLGYRFVAPAAFKLFTREDIFLIQGYDPDEVANNYDQLAAEYEQGDYVVDLCGISEGAEVSLTVDAMPLYDDTLETIHVVAMMFQDYLDDEDILIYPVDFAGREFVRATGFTEQTERGTRLKEIYVAYEYGRVIIVKVEYYEGHEAIKEEVLSAFKPYGYAVN